MIKTLISNLQKALPPSLIRPDDGTVILSLEDIHRRRLAIIAGVGFVLVAIFTIIQISAFDFQRTAIFNLVTGLLSSMLCAYGFGAALWRNQLEEIIPPVLYALSAMLWLEVAIGGGITGYHGAIFPVLPLIGALLLKMRETLRFAGFNLLVVAVLALLEGNTDMIPSISMGLDSMLILTCAMLMISIIACTGAALIMSHQNLRVEGQLRELVEYQSHLAAHDHLSGLGNRMRLQQRFDENTEASFDILLIDLDGFKAVNDTYGHNAGDYLIKALAERLRELTDAKDLLVRLGGDEFVILLEGVDGPLVNVRKYAEYLIGVLSRPYPWNGHVLRVSASIGHARYPHHGATPSKALSLADKALYVAKDAGKAQCVTYGVRPQPKPDAAPKQIKRRRKVKAAS